MLQIQRLLPEKRQEWKKFLLSSLNGTLFHDLDFLSYHGDKFSTREHHLCWYKGEELFAILPLLIEEVKNQKIARSPFGASWGGIVTTPKIDVSSALEITGSLIAYLQSIDVCEVRLAPPPVTCYSKINQSIDFALLSKGFSLVTRDVTHVVELTSESDVWQLLNSKSRNQSRRGLENFTIQHDASLEAFYAILEEDKARLKAPITHTLDELILLKERCPKRIFSDLATSRINGGQAGILYFVLNEISILTFYMAQSDIARGQNGLNALIVEGIKRAKEMNFKYLDFGTSSIGGTILNIGVSNFKESFGAKSFFREHYKLSLNG